MNRFTLIVVALLTSSLQELSAKSIADKEILSRISQYDKYTRDGGRVLSRTSNGWPKVYLVSSETFALYNQLAPTLFTLVGVQNPELDTTAGHHTGKFDIDEDALQYVIGTMVKVAVSY